MKNNLKVKDLCIIIIFLYFFFSIDEKNNRKIKYASLSRLVEENDIDVPASHVAQLHTCTHIGGINHFITHIRLFFSFSCHNGIAYGNLTRWIVGGSAEWQYQFHSFFFIIFFLFQYSRLQTSLSSTIPTCVLFILFFSIIVVIILI